jgi:VCBS repeat protein/stage II sporulation SpoD-like protein
MVGLCALALAVLSLSPSSSGTALAGGRSDRTTSEGSAATSDGKAARCSTWSNTVVPPETIRVYRTSGPASGTVQVVDLRTWSKVVLAAEMPSYYPSAALRANALAIKQFGWYYAMHWRGGRAANGSCYDVSDSGDGYYDPESRHPTATQIAAVDATWAYSLRKRDWQTGASHMFLTGYRAGAMVPCGSDSDRFHLFQHSAFDCGKRGFTWEGIIRAYMEPQLEVVRASAHQVLGSAPGDVTATLATVTGKTETKVYASTGASFARPVTRDFGIDPASTLGVASADVTGDGRSDLVVLERTSTGTRLRVLASTGTRLAPPVDWWSDANAGNLKDVRLVAADFDGDGVADAALVRPGTSAGYATLSVLRSLGDHFGAPTRTWTGVLPLAKVEVFAGDANGDGRADLIVERDRGTGGVEFLLALSASGGGDLSALRRWYIARDLRRATTRTAVGDYDRDGRDDLILAIPNGRGTRVVGLKVDARTNARYLRSTLWSSARTSPISIDRVKIATGDYDSDGLTDAVLLVDLGKRGTRLIRLKTQDSADAMSAAVWYTDDSLDWSRAETP